MRQHVNHAHLWRHCIGGYEQDSHNILCTWICHRCKYRWLDNKHWTPTVTLGFEVLSSNRHISEPVLLSPGPVCMTVWKDVNDPLTPSLSRLPPTFPFKAFSRLATCSWSFFTLALATAMSDACSLRSASNVWFALSVCVCMCNQQHTGHKGLLSTFLLHLLLQAL